MADENVAVQEQGDSKADEKARKKEEKRQKKLEKKAAKEAAEQEEGQETVLGKIGVVFATLLIIAIWLGILALLVRLDVGGFGSTVLYPILKDVPYVNRILPEVKQSEEDLEAAVIAAKTLTLKCSAEKYAQTARFKAHTADPAAV